MSPVNDISDVAPQFSNPQVYPEFCEVLNLWCQHLPAQFPVCLVHVFLQVVAHDGLLADGLPRLHGSLLDAASFYSLASLDADGRHLRVPSSELCHVFGHPPSSVCIHFLPEGGVEMQVQLPVDGVPLESSGSQLGGQFRDSGSFPGVELEKEQVIHLPAEGILEQD